MTDAWHAWLKINSSNHAKGNPHVRLAFAKFIGNKSFPVNFPRGACPSFELTPEQEERVRLLTGPHAKTLVKVWLAKNPIVLGWLKNAPRNNP